MKLETLLTFTLLSASLTSGALANPSKPKFVGEYYVCPNGLGAPQKIFKLIDKSASNGSLTWGGEVSYGHNAGISSQIISIKQEVIIRKNGNKNDISSAKKVVEHLLYNNVQLPTSYKSYKYERAKIASEHSVDTYLKNSEGKSIKIRNGQDEILTQDGNTLYTRGNFYNEAKMEGGGIADFCDYSHNTTIRRRIVERKRVTGDANKTIKRGSMPEMYYITDFHIRIQSIPSPNTESIL